MKKLVAQFSRFFMVGGFSALIQFSILTVLVELALLRPIFASSFGYLAGAFTNYLLNHYFTFKSTLPHRQALLRFSLNSLFGFFLNFSMMYFFLWHYPYLLSQVLSSIVILTWNFMIHHCWTFRP